LIIEINNSNRVTYQPSTRTFSKDKSCEDYKSENHKKSKGTSKQKELLNKKDNRAKE